MNGSSHSKVFPPFRTQAVQTLTLSTSYFRCYCRRVLSLRFTPAVSGQKQVFSDVLAAVVAGAGVILIVSHRETL